MGKPIYEDSFTRLRKAEALVAQLTAENEKLRADLAYVAMMTDVDIDDEQSEQPTNEEVE